MKKLKKLDLEKKSIVKLGNKQTKELKGGYDGNINNNNTVKNCKCDYSNRRDISNSNSVSGCSCNCV